MFQQNGTAFNKRLFFQKRSPVSQSTKIKFRQGANNISIDANPQLRTCRDGLPTGKPQIL
jgi:hypothetical protein